MKPLATLAVLMIVAMPRASNAATIVFDMCDVASLCNQLTFNTTLTAAGAIDVSVQSTSPGYGIFGQTGANHAFGFNIAGSETGLNITNLTSGFTWAAPDQQISGYGFFEAIIDGPMQGANATLPLNFTVSRTGGFLSDTALFETNAAGFIAAAHLRNNQTGATGFVAGDGDLTPTPASAVPEPATMLLLGTGLLAAARARRRQSAQP